MPLSEAYNSDMATSKDMKNLDEMSFVTTCSLPITLSSGSQSKIKWRLSVAFVGIANHTNTYKKISKLAKKDELDELYSKAINAVNKTILAYKMTPGRHNHDLKTITKLDRPSVVDVVRYDVLSGDLLESQSVALHDNLRLSATHARDLDGSELTAFRNIHVAISSDLQTEGWIVSKLYQAIDARCNGDCSYSIILADTFAEHAMIYMLFMMLIPKIGQEAAAKKIDDIKKIDVLKNEIAEQLQLSSKLFTKESGYKSWDRDCHKVRNPLTHMFIEQIPTQEQAQAALDSSVSYIAKLADMIMDKYEDCEKSLTFFQLTHWYKDIRNQVEAES
jgi:hypothetical protein